MLSYKQYKSQLEENIKGKLTVYHGTNKPFKKFNMELATQRIIWFTSDKDGIIQGEKGAQGKGYILTLEVEINNPAGWNEYEKYGLGELEQMKYDGVILPDPDGSYDGFVFNDKKLKIIKAEKV